MNWTPVIWLAWLALFLALELPALPSHRLVPWTTLSEFAWGLEDSHPVFRWVFLVGLATLLSHIVARWPE